ncbi:hypothetical protein [Streptomyces sp. NPDC008001]|uniref:hypothetical protein n=1 Tax=Streptomyces sp. NPDC008001 TaxID=3364804 RepID=UPI0036ED8AED
MVVRRAGEQLHELVAFGRAQRREQFRTEVVQGLVEAGQATAAAGGDRDDGAAPVGGIR